jgi:3-deoxy-D-manno-octulosonic-acid transferase
MTAAAPWWYELLWRIALPFALFRLWWRGRKEPGYRSHVAERLGRYPVPAPLDRGEASIWIHAVSVGETRAAQPLIAALSAKYPAHRIVITHMTAAGRETGRALLGERVDQVYLPYDYSSAVEAFLDRFRPQFGILMETELWPNLILRGAARGVPVFLANARLSQRSAARYARFPRLTRVTLQSLAGISAQADSDAARLTALGATGVHVAGNIKFDLDVSADSTDKGRALRDRFGPSRPVWVAGSTRDGEEAMLLAAMRAGGLPTDALFILVPRHPQRFDEVAKLLDKSGYTYVRRSGSTPVTRDVAVVLGDSMGEMLAYYAAADVVFVGGSLLPLGGQNLIEPIAVGAPTRIGPHMFNFAAASDAAVAAGAARRGRDADEVFAAARELLDDDSASAAMRERATAFVAAHRGAVDRLWEWLGPKIDEGPGARDQDPGTGG